MEQQVFSAASAMINPNTDSQTRSAASLFLEQWTQTTEAWNVYLAWLQSFSFSEEGMQLLCLTLLQSKIRRDIHRHHSNLTATTTTGTSSQQQTITLDAIRHTVMELLANAVAVADTTTTKSNSAVTNQLCACLAAMTVRLGTLNEVVDMCTATHLHKTTTVMHLKLLGALPPEVEGCGMTTPQVTAELWPFMEVVLNTVQRSLIMPETDIAALECLRNWALSCHITLSHLNSPTCGGTEPILPCLISVLSNPHPSSEALLISASNALMEAILNPSDSCTPTRTKACELMLTSMETMGFVVAPFQTCTMNSWEDGAHALACMICTFVTEEVDDIVTQPAEACLSLLLNIQHHEHIPISLCVLDVWLTVQEVPTNSRHEHWQQPLFIKVVEGLVKRISYPANFVDWEQEVHLDPQEFSELRRMVADVLVSCYFLLRVTFVKIVTVFQGDWNTMESRLYCLSCVSREVCARVKARGHSTSLSSDRDATSHELLQMVERLCSAPLQQQHPLLLASVVSFMGLYAPAWNVHCSQEAVLQLLSYLRATMSSSCHEASSRATRAIYVGCSSKLLEEKSTALVLDALREGMMIVLGTDSEGGMSDVAEGSTRLAGQLRDPILVQQALSSFLIPLLHRADHTLSVILDGAYTDLATEALAKYLHVLSVIIRFCDGNPSPLPSVLSNIWPFMEKVAQNAGQYESVLDEILTIHKQLLSNAPDLVAPHFSETVKFVVDAYQRTKHPSTLDTIGCAVEAFSPISGETETSFNQLLGHVTGITYNYVTTEKGPDECPQVIRAFFEMNQRYILFCPTALVCSSQFSCIVSLGVECLSACKGERESTRSTLNFLAQLFGWRSLRLSHASMASLEDVSGPIDEQLAQHGQVITQMCIGGLSGGSPQPLWPSLSDCLFAIVTHITGSNATGPIVEEHTVAHQWVYASLVTVRTNNGNAFSHDTIRQIMTILFDLARTGQKSKPKAKMLLTDFAKMCKGEMDTNALLSYSLP